MNTIGRRGLLGATGLAALGAAVGCSGGPASTDRGNASVVSPTHRALQPVAPDFPIEATGGFPGFVRYPDHPTTLHREPFLNGETITALGYTYDPPTKSAAANPVWQHLNTLMGGRFDFDYVGAADYSTRFATTIAGGDDLPDVVAIRTPVTELPKLLRAKFTPLTEHLSGSAVEKYPSLANLSPLGWPEASFDGDLWGVPITGSPLGNALYARADLFAKYGASTAPADYAELTESFAALSDERARRYACGGDVASFADLVVGMHQIPSGWSLSDGALSHAIEHPGYPDALEDMRKLVAQGFFHPDAVASPNTTRNGWFLSGTVASVYAGFTGWFKFVNWGRAVAGFELAGVIPGGRDGGSMVYPGQNAYTEGFAAISRRVSADKVPTVLTALDFLTAPFGSAEYLARFYGVADQTYTTVDHNPRVRSGDESLVLIPFQYLVRSPGIVYFGGLEDQVRRCMAFQQKALGLRRPSPVSGAYSETQAAQGATLSKAVGNAQLDIFYGRAATSSWPDVVARWKHDGGDRIRTELTAGSHR